MTRRDEFSSMPGSRCADWGPSSLWRAALLIVLVGLLGVPAAQAQPTTLFVDRSATGANDGSSWGDAYEFLQDALDRANSKTSTDYEIRIAEGVYYPDEDNRTTFRSHTDNSPNESFSLSRDGVTIRGGYPAGGGTRDPAAHKTVLSGDIDADNGGADNNKTATGVTPTASDINGTNSYHVFFLDGAGTQNITEITVLDGVVVTAGNANGPSPNDRGGGLFCVANDGTTDSDTCSPTLRDVVFVGNGTVGDGGGLYNDGRNNGTASPKIANAVFLANGATNGGAIYNDGGPGGAAVGTSSPSLTNVTCAKNQASSNGGAIYNDGESGGIAAPTITNTILRGNTASTSGAEIFNFKSGATPTLDHSLLPNGAGQVAGSGDFSAVTDTIRTDLPVFADASNPVGADGRFGTVDDGLNLGLDAPALDAGTNAALPSSVSSDITGGARVQDLDGNGTATVNMGAYESFDARSPIITGDPIAGSVTGITEWIGLNPAGAETVVQFQVKPATSSGFTTADTDTLVGAAQQVATGTALGLTGGTTYDVRAVATSAEGRSESAPITISVPAAPQLSDTDQTVRIVLRGTQNTLPIQASTFEVEKGGEQGPQFLSPATVEGDEEGTAGRRILEVTVPSALVTDRGLTYTASFTTNSGISLSLPGDLNERGPLSLPVSVPLAPADSLNDDLFQPETYRMVSVPASANPKTILTNTYGPYRTSKWRTLQWDATQDAYQEFPDLDSTDLQAGNAFWLVTEDGDSLSTSRGQTVDVSVPRAVELAPGWNQVGNPFGFAVEWTTVQAATDLSASDLDGPYRRGGSGYVESTELVPWRGYFVFNATSETDTLRIPPKAAGASTPSARQLGAHVGAASGKGASGAYTLRMTARTKNGPSTATMGLRSGAKAGRDQYDAAKPPAVRPSTQISVAETIGKRSVPHAKSMNPSGGSGQTWTLRLRRPEKGSTPSSVRLDWNASGSLPEGQSRYVIDPSTETRVASGKRFSLDKGETRRLKVIVGTERYARKQSAAALTQYETALRGNYPNPFDEATTLEYTLSREREVTMQVYNVLGQWVETLVDSRTSAGVHTVTWDGTNRYGDRVGSGVYFVRMEAGSTTETQKVVLVR